MLRRRAAQALADVREETSEDNQAAVGSFVRQYSLLTKEWDDFHAAYDAWRVTEGGCDRADAIATLGQFALRFGELSKQVRELPRASFLRPVGELFVEAVEREEQALTDLRNHWRPFDPGVYGTLDRERVEARRLRRQIAVGVEDLLARYGISAQELDSAAGP